MLVVPQMVEKQGWTYVSKPNQLIRDAHPSVGHVADSLSCVSVPLQALTHIPLLPTQGSEISCLTFSSDSNTLLSRGTDGTLKIWDLRR